MEGIVVGLKKAERQFIFLVGVQSLEDEVGRKEGRRKKKERKKQR